MTVSGSAKILACAAVLMAPPSASAQRPVVDVVAGGRQFTDGTGMLVAELRAGLAPPGWPIRPTIGLSGATDFAATQTEVTLGGQVDITRNGWLQISAGAGAAHIVQDGGEWNSGRSTGAYASGSLLFAPAFLGGAALGIDSRYLAAPDFTRADGLTQGIGFLQFAAIARVNFNAARN